VAAGFMLLFSDCKCNKSRKQIDVSNIDIDVKIQRFDQDFFSINNENYATKVAALKNQYGAFYSFYVNELMGGFKNTTQASASEQEAILNFLGDTAIAGLSNTVQKNYPDLKIVEVGLQDAFKHIKYYFPELPQPRVISMISEFSYGAVTYDTATLAISLDMFLTEKYAVYNYLEIPKYIQRKLNKNYIVPNSVDVLYGLYFGEDVYEPGTPLLEAMVAKGKKLYFMEMMLPETPDSMLIGYTSEQMRWCKLSEYAMWQYLNEKDLIFSQSFMEHKRYLTDGPTTSGMPAESPGNLGSWIGWQMVRKFMNDADGKVTLKDLLTKYDNKTIAAKANYRPRK
jgi:hypothetical protein